MPCAWRTLLLLPVSLSPLSAAVELSPNWGLLFDVRPEVVYDTNLTARRENLVDWYASVTPQLTLSRRGSATRFDVDVQVTRTWFDEFREFNSTDPEANLHFAFPSAPGDETRSRVDLHRGRSSATNTDLGRRLRSDNLRGLWEQQVFNTGRTAVDLLLSARSVDYLDVDLNTNESYAAGVRAGYALTSRARLGLAYTHEWTRSLGPGAVGDTDGDEDRVVVRASGELTPTLRGSVEAGVAFVSFVGVVTRDDTAWVAAADLTWQPRPELAAVLRAARYNDFSPNGGTALRSEIFLDVTRELGRGFSLRGGGGVSRLETFSNAASNESDAVILLVGLGYRLTERLSFQLTDRWTSQSADQPELDYRRHLVSGVMTLSF
jgi:hypothetical protein